MKITPPWADAAAPAPTNPSSSASSTSIETVDELKTPMHIARRNGFLVGTYVQHKKSKDIAKIVKLEADKVEMQSHEGGITARVDYKSLMDAYKNYKGKLSGEALGCSIEASPSRSVDWGYVAIKGAIAMAMQSHLADAEATAFDLCTPYENPMCVKAAKDIQKNELRLVCASTRVDHKAIKGTIFVGTFSATAQDTVSMYVSQQLTMPVNKDGADVDNPWFCHFWCVENTADTKQVNLELVWEKVSVHKYDVMVPVLTNPRVIKGGTKLKRLKVTDHAQTPDNARKRKAA